MAKLSLTTLIQPHKSKKRLCVFLHFVDYAVVKKAAKGKRLTLKATGEKMPTPNQVISNVLRSITWKGDYALDSIEPANQRVTFSEVTDAEKFREYFQTKSAWQNTDGKPCTVSCIIMVYHPKHEHLAKAVGLLSAKPSS